MLEGPAHHGQCDPWNNSLGLYRADWVIHREQASKQRSSKDFCFRSCLQVPALPSLADVLWPISQINPFLLQEVWAMVFIAAIRNQTRTKANLSVPIKEFCKCSKIPILMFIWASLSSEDWLDPMSPLILPRDSDIGKQRLWRTEYSCWLGDGGDPLVRNEVLYAWSQKSLFCNLHESFAYALSSHAPSLTLTRSTTRIFLNTKCQVSKNWPMMNIQ